MSRDFRPTASWSNLQRRAELLRRLRAFFDRRGFLEVETPILSADTVVDRHLDPFRVVGGQWPVVGSENTNPQSPIPNSSVWLQTSPEFTMKRMLAAGAGRIYQVARVFRQDEIGPLHNPEFTLVEWYQPGDGLDAGMQLTSDLCEETLRRGPADRVTYAEAFDRCVGVDPHTSDGRQLAETAQKLGVASPESLSLDDRDGWLDLLLVERIQPHLGVGRPVLLYDYPASQAALARTRQDAGRPPVAERFELYANGVELANGYHELLDPSELRARNVRVNAQRVADGKEMLPEESRLLAAMESGLPTSVGVALGFDRLAMLALGVKTIAEVVAFPFDRA
ncbi:MAG: EF-P lysine aminoacylase EpmA [Thermoguttaceae bacterium]